MIFLILSLLFFSLPASAGIIFYSGFENGIIQNDAVCTDCWDKTKRTCGLPWSLNAVNEGTIFNQYDDGVPAPQAKAGSKMLRQEIREADTCSNVSFNHRNELINTSIMKTGNEYWIGFSFYAPTTGHWPLPGVACSTHGYSNQTKLAPGTLSIVVTGESLNPRADGPYSPWSWWLGNALGKWAPQKYGQWQDFVYHMIFKQGTAGFVQVWVDGVSYGSKNSAAVLPSTFGTIPDGYKLDFRLSQYVAPTCAEEKVLINYFDEVRIGDANSSYAQVDPSGGAPPPPPQGTVPVKPVNLQVQ